MVFQQIVGLVDTLSEGFEYTRTLLTEDKRDEALEVLYNIIAGIESVINALNPHLEELPANDLKGVGAHMSIEFNKLIDIFNGDEVVLIENHLESTLIPAFLVWKSEIEKVLMPFILS